MVNSDKILHSFKAIAESKEVDTTNKQGYNGYKGTIYKLGNLVLFDTYNYFRFNNPTSNIKYLKGTTRISKKDFIDKATKFVAHEN